MSSEFDNEMRFALFKNDKAGNEKRPDYRGTMQIAGVEYELSAWIRDAKNGTRFMSGQVQPKRDRSKNVQNQQTHGEPAGPAPATGGTEENDDVPF